MAQARVGSVATLWRYPVKSMLGEELEASEITAHGLVGDRAYALWDVASGRVASAKNPKKWAKLLDFQAAFVETPQSTTPLPAVQMVLPDGTSVTSETEAVEDMLSETLGRSVQLLSSAPEKVSLDQYWPQVEGTVHQDTITELVLPTGTFFDSCPIHLVTTSTLSSLQTLYPDGQFEPCRFRPNILIEPTEPDAGFVEDAWVGGLLAIGDQVRLQIDTACPRCVVTTLAQQGLPQDLDILRTTIQHHNMIAGIRASVVQGGVIHRHDPIWLES
ncbi:MAG: MOSC domain-containing protein [Leptolyngbya sp. DLM2.Bin15]|nr:MAG: MOSC domain-containing protein [Leptolyngbya sp. DLM2.Bin15]